MLQDNAFLDATEALFARAITPEVIANLEAGADAAALWTTLSDAGLDHALAREEDGGLALSWSAFFPLAVAAGEHAVPLPLVETALLRGALNTLPEGPVAIATALRDEAGTLIAPRVPFGAVAHWVAVEIEGQAKLYPTQGAIRARYRLDADIALVGAGEALADGLALREIGALAQAARIAGALKRVLAMSLEHTKTRQQFGRRLADFQAVQHQLAELAEAVQLASLAAEMGFAPGVPARGSLLAALAKARTSALVPRGAAIAHAVHGAMGIAAEFPLQIFTRALHSARLAHASESLWHQAIGEALLGSGQGACAFVDHHLTPAD